MIYAAMALLLATNVEELVSGAALRVDVIGEEAVDRRLVRSGQFIRKTIHLARRHRLERLRDPDVLLDVLHLRHADHGRASPAATWSSGSASRPEPCR